VRGVLALFIGATVCASIRCALYTILVLFCEVYEWLFDCVLGSFARASFGVVYIVGHNPHLVAFRMCFMLLLCFSSFFTLRCHTLCLSHFSQLSCD
jgi:hypothetical protein